MMIHRHRGILVLSLITAGSLAAILVTWYMSVFHLPHPSQANREQVFRWLVLRDLKLESHEIRIALVDRLQDEMGKDIQLDDQTASLSDSQRVRIVSNVELLKQVWFVQRVGDYHECLPENRMAFLARQLDTISRWTAIDSSLESASTNGGSSGRSNNEGSFFRDIDSWVAQADPAEQERMGTALKDGVVCWLATRELSEQPMGVRLELALRIARYLDSGAKVDSAVASLTSDQQRLLMSNGELLMEAWLHDRADAFFEMPETERDAFVGDQIDSFTKWGLVEWFAKSSGESPSAWAAQIKFMAMIQSWIARAEPDKRERLQELFTQVAAQWLKRG